MAVGQARFPLVLNEEISEIILAKPQPQKQPKHGWQHG